MEELEGIYLLCGEENFLIESMIKKIKKSFGEKVEGINYIKIDDTNIASLVSNIETPAFGYFKKLVIVKNSGILKKEGKKKNVSRDELIDKISNYIEKNVELINESIILVFVEQEFEKNKLYKVIEKYGKIYNYEQEKLPQLIKRIQSICNAYKVTINDQVAKYFVECCGTNMQDLINEIRKLIEYVGENNSIKKEDIDILSVKQLEVVIFDLTDNLGKKDISKALEVLNGLIYAKEPIQKILITLYNHFKKLYIAKISEKEKLNLAESIKLKPTQMFLTTKYKKQAEYFKEEELRKMLDELINLDTNYKSGLIDLQVGLESILCRYCSK